MTDVVINPELKKSIDARLDGRIQRFYRDVPSARHQLEDRELTLDYSGAT